MTDDIDHQYDLIQTHPIRGGFCPVCGMRMKGFTECPWCGGKRKVVRRKRLCADGKWIVVRRKRLWSGWKKII